MIKKVNKNKFGVIEYSITSEEDLGKLPKGDTDNSVYAVDDENKVYLYSKKTNNYILINGGGVANSNEFTIKSIKMDSEDTEVDYELFEGDGYYSVSGTINGNVLHDTLVYLTEAENQCSLTLYECCKHVFGARNEKGVMQYDGEQLFNILQTTIGNLGDLPSELQNCTLVEAIVRICNEMNPQ